MYGTQLYFFALEPTDDNSRPLTTLTRPYFNEKAILTTKAFHPSAPDNISWKRIAAHLYDATVGTESLHFNLLVCREIAHRCVAEVA